VYGREYGMPNSLEYVTIFPLDGRKYLKNDENLNLERNPIQLQTHY
jgi:hypothetical protein